LWIYSHQNDNHYHQDIWQKQKTLVETLSSNQLLYKKLMVTFQLKKIIKVEIIEAESGTRF
jgi:hypothetical protein